MYYPPVPYQQYYSAYPAVHYHQPPSAANGYGWHGNGYGWQLDPSSWHTPSLYPSLNEVVEEPPIEAQKVEKVNAYNPSVSILHVINENLTDLWLQYLFCRNYFLTHWSIVTTPFVEENQLERTKIVLRLSFFFQLIYFIAKWNSYHLYLIGH